MLPINPAQFSGILPSVTAPQKGQNLPVFPGAPKMTSEEKLKFAANLREVADHYDQHLPFSKKRGVVSSLLYSFDKFIRKVLGKAPPLPFSEIELRFTMHLFRNFEKEALDLAYLSKGKVMKGFENQIPFSTVLKVWIHFFSSMPELQKDIDINALIKCRKYQKEIEEARISWKWRRNSKIRRLAKNIGKDMAKLEQGQKMYIPGGGLTPTSLNSVQMHQMLYEVSRSETEPGEFIFKVIDISAGSPVKTYQVSEEDLREKMEVLLFAETVAVPGLDQLGLLGLYRMYKKKKNPLELLNNSTGMMQLQNVLKEFKKVDVPDDAIIPQQTDPEKVFELFQKAFQGTSAKEHKLLLKTALFFHIYECSEKRLSDPIWNKWMRDNAIQLLNSIENRVGEPENDDLKVVEAKFQAILEALENAETKGKKRALPVSPQEQKQASHRFEESPLSLDPHLPIDKVKALKRTAAVIKTPEVAIDYLQASPQEAYTQMKGQIKETLKLVKKGKLEAAQEKLEDFFVMLQKWDEAGFGKLKAEDALQWSSLVNEALNLECRVHFGLNIEAPIPNMILNFVKCLEITQKLAHLRGKEGEFTDYCLDMKPYKEMFKDPYLDVGGLGPEISEVIGRIEGKGLTPLRLTTVLINQMGGAERDFYKDFIKDHPDIKIPPDTFLGINITFEGVPTHLTGDFGQEGLLPPHIVHLKQAALLSQMMMARHRTLHMGGVINFVVGAIKAGNEAAKEAKKEGIADRAEKRKILEDVRGRRVKKTIDRHLAARNQPLSFEIDFDLPAGGTSLKIHPYGINFHNFDWWGGAQLGLRKDPVFCSTGEPVADKDIRTRVVEGEVQGNIWGVRVDYSNATYREHERGTIEEKKSIAGLPLDISVELQLMQTGMTETRIPQTLGFFMNHPALLTDEKIGIDLQRVFKLNLFRANALGLKVTKEPVYAEAFARDLERILKGMEANQDVKGSLFLMEVIEEAKTVLNHYNLNQLDEPCERNFNRLQAMLENAETNPCKKEIYQGMLHHYHERRGDPVNEKGLSAILKAYLLYQQMPKIAKEQNRTRESNIKGLMKGLQPQLEQLLVNPETRDKVLFSVLGKECHFEPSPSYPVFKSGNIEVDVLRGRIFEDNVAKGFLSQGIIQDPACRELFGTNELFSVRAKQRDIKAGDEEGEQYEFSHKQRNYKILSFSNKAPIIYRQEGKQWHQLQNLRPFSKVKSSKNEDKNLILSVIKGGIKKVDKVMDDSLKDGVQGNLPQHMLEMACWVAPDGSRFKMEDEEGKVIFEGKISSRGDTSILKEIRNVEKSSEILHPLQDTRFETFLALDAPNQVVFSGDKGKVGKVYYPRHELEYIWKDNHWKCLNFDGYFISGNSIDDKLFPAYVLQEGENPFLFAPYFKDYHLLEHPSKQARILLSGDKYEPAKEKGVAPHLLKYMRAHTKKIPTNINSTPPLYSFEVDPIQGLKSETKEGYLYLAYLLFTQKRYAQSVFYLRKAADVKVGASPEADQIIEWFKGWEDSSIEASALQLHLASIIVEQKKAAGVEVSPTDIPLEHVQRCMSGKIDPAVDFSQKQLMLLMGTFIDPSVYKMQIKMNAKMVKMPENVFPEYELNVFDSLKEFLTVRPPADPEEIAVWKERLEELEKSFRIGQEVPEEEEFKQELGQELITDLDFAINQRLSQVTVLKEGTDLKKLAAAISAKKDEHLKKSSELKAEILNEMTFPDLNESFIGIARQLEHYDTLKHRYFEEALYCTATNDFRSLIDAKIIQEWQEEDLTLLVEDFLIEATSGAQYQKAADFVEQLQKGPSESVSTQFQELLNTSRYFDPKNDPYRLPILLMEYFSKNIAYKSQVQNVRDMLIDTNVFKHEALAGGKTTFLRNIISKIKADGVTLSGVMTHEPLFGMHHPLYEKTTREAYGEKAWVLSFTRNDPSDVKALKLIHGNMLKEIAEKGRISTTRSDLLSLRNIFLQKYDELWKGKGDTEEKHAEIDALSAILKILKEHTSIGNDELEKILAPDNENNYTSGDEKGSLNEVKGEAALEMTEWLLTDPRYKDIFQKNQHSKMDPAAVNQLMIDLAQKVHDKYLPETDLEQCIRYLMAEGPFEERLQFYKTHVVASQNNQILFAFHKFLSQVVKGSFLKEGGDGYKRSEEGIEVKYARDGKVNPRSEFGTEEETIWYTCLNYMDITHGGVSSDQMGRIIGKYRDQAFQETIQSFKDDPSCVIDVTNTRAFVAFTQQFGLNLLEVTPEDWAAMAEMINKDPKKLVELLRKDVLPHYVVSPEKIAANSQDLALMLYEVYGSSGTSNNWRALPDSIKKEPRLVKQKGVDGAVAARLHQTYVSGDIIAITTNQDLATQVGGLLSSNKGSSLIDLGPFFPGKSSQEIGEILKPHLANQSLRLLDENDEVVTPQGVPVEELVTIYAKANCRGTNLVSGNDAIGFVTIGPLTTWTDYLQATMRMRKLGKGQKTKNLLDPAVVKILGPNPNLADLEAFLMGNEAELLKNRSHLKGEKQKIPAIAKANLFTELVKTKDRQLRMEAKAFRPFFFKPSQESLESCGMPKEEKATSAVVTKMAEGEKGKLGELLQFYLDSQPQAVSTIATIQDAINKLDEKINGVNRIPDKYLPKLTVDTPSDLDVEQEQEREQEQEVEAEKEQEQEQEVEEARKKSNYRQNELLITTPEKFLGALSYDSSYIRLKDKVKFYGPRLYATQNLLQYADPWGAEDIKGKVKGQNRIFRTIFIVDNRQDPAEVHTLFGNLKDHDNYLGKLDKTSDSGKLDVYFMNMQTGNFDGELTQMKDYSPETQEQIARSIVQAKFFAGQVDLVKPSQKGSIIRNESDAFKTWLQEQSQDQVSLMEENLKKYLKEYRPSVYAEYHKSEMAKVFKEVL